MEALGTGEAAVSVLGAVLRTCINVGVLGAEHSAHWRYALAPAHGQAPSTGKAEGRPAILGHHLRLSQAHFPQPGGHIPDLAALAQDVIFMKDSQSRQYSLAKQGPSEGAWPKRKLHATVDSTQE